MRRVVLFALCQGLFFAAIATSVFVAPTRAEELSYDQLAFFHGGDPISCNPEDFLNKKHCVSTGMRCNNYYGLNQNCEFYPDLQTYFKCSDNSRERDCAPATGLLRSITNCDRHIESCGMQQWGVCLGEGDLGPPMTTENPCDTVCSCTTIVG